MKDKTDVLEAKVDALKMLIDKALDMAMSALLEAREAKAAIVTTPPPFTPAEPVKSEPQDIPTNERISPFSFRGKIDTEKGVDNTQDDFY